MKKIVFFLALTMSASAFSQIAIYNISREDQKKVGNEFGVNFAHTTVSAPETDGGVGFEVGVLATQTNSPHLSRVVERNGGDGDEYDHLYGAGILARIILPLDFFLEGTILPKQDIEDIDVKSHSYSAGWNLGGLLNLGFDLAAGASYSNSDIKYSQVDDSSTIIGPVEGNVNMDAKTQVYYVAIGKKMGFFNPYFKYGTAQNDTKTSYSGSGTFFLLHK